MLSTTTIVVSLVSGLISLLLLIVGWFIVTGINAIRTTQEKQTETLTKMQLAQVEQNAKQAAQDKENDALRRAFDAINGHLVQAGILAYAKSESK